MKPEYKVNPHIRNKQALDMDLVLACQKRSPLDSPLLRSITLATVLQQIVQELDEEEFKEMSENQLFLHFMEELLRLACTTQTDIVIFTIILVPPRTQWGRVTPPVYGGVGGVQK